MTLITGRSAWSDPSDPSTVCPVVIDDARQAKPVGCGYLKSSILSANHGFHPTLLLSAFSAKDKDKDKDVVNVSSTDVDDFTALLLRVVGVPGISDNKLFPLRTRTFGEPTFLKDASARLKVVS